ncbi:hypothetical protein D3C80_1520360 [compost metagenome]
MQRFRPQVGVAPEHLPILVTCDEGHVLNLKTCLEQAARPLMAKVVKMQVSDFEAFAGPCERRTG